MSIATLAAPMAATVDRPTEDYVTLAEAARLTGLHQTTLLRLALAGQVRHRTRGLRTVFHRADVLKAAG